MVPGARLLAFATWLAFTLTVVNCGLRHALTEGTGMWKDSLIALAVAMGLGIASEMAIVDARRTGADFPPGVLLAIALRSASVAAFATALLPALFLLRRDSRITGRTAALSLAAGALLTAAAIVMLPDPNGYQLTPDQNEQMYQRAVANDRARQSWRRCSASSAGTWPECCGQPSCERSCGGGSRGLRCSPWMDGSPCSPA